MGFERRVIITFFVIFFCAIAAKAQDAEPERAKNTIELNAATAFFKTVDVIYTRQLKGSTNIMVEAGYCFPRRVLAQNQVPQLESEAVSGFFFKAGPEVCKYKGSYKYFSFSILPYYSEGHIVQEIVVPHVFGEFRKDLNSSYHLYGIGVRYNQRIWNFNTWFIEGSAELSFSEIMTNAELPLQEYPGIGGVDEIGLGFRILGKVGFRF